MTLSNPQRLQINPFPDLQEYKEYQIIDSYNNLLVKVPRFSSKDISQLPVFENREKVIPRYQIIQTLVEVRKNWLNPQDKYRLETEKYLPLITGFSVEMVREVLDITFQELTQEKLEKVSTRIKTPNTKKGIVTHILAGNIFTSGLFGIIYGLLSGRKQLIKTSSRELLFPILFAKSIQEINPDIAGMLKVCWWKGGDTSIEDIIFPKSDMIIAYGDDASIEDITRRISFPTRFYGFGHKFSFGIIGKEYLISSQIEKTAQNVAYDISMYDQQGCLSPHFFYIESGGEISPAEFSKILAEEMESINQILPRGKINLQESAKIIQQRATYEFRKIKDHCIEVYSSSPSTDWTVVYTEKLELTVSCLNRFIFIKPYHSISKIISELQSVIGQIQCAGLGFEEKREKVIQKELNNLKINRFCKMGEMQKPKLDEFHPGKLNPEDFI